MARIRLTTELLEHLLDLPEGAEVTDVWGAFTEDGTRLVMFDLEVATGSPAAGVLQGEETVYALQYEETEVGTSLVSAIPVPG